MEENKFFKKLLFLYVWLLEKAYGLKFQNLDCEVNIMIRVAGDTPDTPFSVALGAVKDSEGSTVPTTDFVWNDPTSDDEDAVSFVDVVNDGQKVAGLIHFGTPNEDGTPQLANLNVELIQKSTGLVVLNKALSVEVTAGAPVSFEGAFEIEGFPDTP